MFTLPKLRYQRHELSPFLSQETGDLFAAEEVFKANRLPNFTALMSMEGKRSIRPSFSKHPVTSMD